MEGRKTKVRAKFTRRQHLDCTSCLYKRRGKDAECKTRHETMGNCWASRTTTNEEKNMTNHKSRVGKLIKRDGQLNLKEIDAERDKAIETLIEYIKLEDLKGIEITIDAKRKGTHEVELFTLYNTMQVLQVREEKKKSGKRKKKGV